MEMGREDEHKDDVVTRSKFETLCEGEPSLSLYCRRRPRQGRAGRIRRGQNNHGRGIDGGNDGTRGASVTTTTTNNYHTYNDETTRITA